MQTTATNRATHSTVGIQSTRENLHATHSTVGIQSTRENLHATVLCLTGAALFIFAVLWLAPNQAAAKPTPQPAQDKQACVEVPTVDGRGLPGCNWAGI